MVLLSPRQLGIATELALAHLPALPYRCRNLQSITLILHFEIDLLSKAKSTPASLSLPPVSSDKLFNRPTDRQSLSP
jgi:hypothetical protein